MARKAMNENDGKYATMCCCCVCVCEDEATDGEKCCFCFPIKCGVSGIAASIFLIGIIQFWEVFYQLLNDKIDWWYVAVGVALSIPLVIAWGLTIYWLAEDTDGTRVALQSAAILLVISVALLAAWNAVYFNFLYKDDNVATGNDGIGYITVTVKQQVVFGLWIAAVISAFFAYYLCILSHYKELYRRQQVKDWLEAHGPEAGLPFNHEDKEWPPKTDKEIKEEEDELEDKKNARKVKRDRIKAEKEKEKAEKEAAAKK
jgi:hypothetical protein